ncbi:ABC transporter permease [Winogradskyella sp.]|uniref:ABC transporter permease n=1 Tax=Winogradskyella sp. TaxID=1883156 RepID=UPI003BAC8BB0
MVKNYFKIAWRNLLKHKMVSLLNILGLSTGLACAFLITLWIMDETQVNGFHQNDERLFQILNNIPLADEIETSEHTPGMLANSLMQDIPEVAYATAVIPASWFDSGDGIISIDDKQFKGQGQFVDENYFNVFSWKILEGQKDKPISDKQSVMISRELATKLFDTKTSIIGETITWSHDSFSGVYTISGVFEKPPKNSTIQFDLLFNYDLFETKYLKNLENWGNADPYTYVLLKENTNPKTFDAQIKNLIAKKLGATTNIKKANIPTLFSQKVSDRYLYNQFENGKQAGGRMSYVKLFGLIGLFLIIIASINFMNLSTAISTKRVKEIGVKKVVGANRSDIFWQFMIESILTALVSLVIALFVVILVIPEFNAITGKAIELQWSFNLFFIVLAITLGTGLLAGSYPAQYLSGFMPIKVLNSVLKSSKSEIGIRKGLVVFQFSLSIILIVSVIIVYNQIEFSQSKNLGYTKENIISFKKEGRLNEEHQPLINELKQILGVRAVSTFAHDFVGDHGGTTGVRWEGKIPGQEIRFENFEVDYGLIELLDIKLLEGRLFSEEFSTDEADDNIIFNKTAIELMGLENPIGKTVNLWGKERNIVGVVEDFHFESLYEEIGPCMIRYDGYGQNILVKVNGDKRTLDQIKTTYKSYMGGLELDFTFLDEDYQKLYDAEKRVSILAKYFSGLAILISCLGIFGLSAFTVERRRKEIGIRKVLGQKTTQAIVMLSGEFSKLVVIAILIGLPLAYILVNNWLSDFAYRIPLKVWYFGGAGLLALLITLLTVSFHSVKAATANPVKSLRME